MADDNDIEKQQTLVTLDQLSQTLDVMSHVVARLKDQLNQQQALKQELQRRQLPEPGTGEGVSHEEGERLLADEGADGFVVELASLDMDLDDPVYH